jgi:hypothetical protein
MVDVYLHSPTRLHGLVLNELSIGTTLSFLRYGNQPVFAINSNETNEINIYTKNFGIN